MPSLRHRVRKPMVGRADLRTLQGIERVAQRRAAQLRRAGKRPLGVGIVTAAPINRKRDLFTMLLRYPNAMAIVATICVTLLVAAIALGSASAQTTSSRGPTEKIPANAHARNFGGGWECDRGFREDAGRCQAVAIPESAYGTGVSYGRGWECRRGFRENRGACTAIAVPENAYLDSLGDGWNCQRGFRKTGEGCVAIRVPVDGYLTDESYGVGWACERGFQAINDKCVAVKVPAHAYFVANAYGHAWKCERGFRRVNEHCERVKIPANGHLNHSGNDWECDRPFRKRNQACELP